MPKRSPAAGLSLALLLLGLVRCGSDPQVVVGDEKETDGAQNPSGGTGSMVPSDDPVVMVPSGGQSDGGPPTGAGGACDGDDCGGTVCGNSVIEDGEVCDDGNGRPGDGCSGLCRVEPNYECKEPGEPCESTVECGDSEVSGGEACDDGNDEPDDGCDDECQVERGFACKTPGEACEPVSSEECGDGAVNFGETCDDGDDEGGDGCDDECQLEEGYRCPVPGEECQLLQFCGDGKLSDDEDCDDANTNPGDGCTGRCSLEPFYRCPVPGKPCESTIVCGDLEVVGDEACDDGNTSSDDGCAEDCKSVEPGFVCPTDGGLGGVCEEAEGDVCGDARVSFGEFCDDGNTNPNDGCTADCEVTPGYDCPDAGKLCVLISWCGDGNLDIANGEQCDDGEDPPTGNDGCSALCVIEDLWDCPEPGEACVYRVKCGDRLVMGAETCDDGNTRADDGCSTSCQTEDGWICPPGARCRARECGDGIIAGNERCDDGDDDDGDGCSSICQVTPGFACSGSPSVCTPTRCGDGNAEGSEQCDNDMVAVGQTPAPFDGCSATCTNEPSCSCSGCEDVCGDGMKFTNEACDDGNRIDGDGCDSNCAFEPGYSCSVDTFTDTQPCSGNSSQDCLVLPIVYRDFRGHDGGGTCPGSTNAPRQTPAHPHFGIIPTNDVRLTGIVQPDMCATWRPTYNQSFGTGGFAGTTMNGRQPCANGTATPMSASAISDAFDQWYTDAAGVNQRFGGTIELLPVGNEFQFDRSFSNPTPALQQFFPLDGRGFGNINVAGNHNFHFTSEMRYWFAFQGGEELEFRGDDDVWVFVNGRLVVDLGGIHSEWLGVVTLDGTNASVRIGTGPKSTTLGSAQNVPLPLTPGDVYEIALFQAERHITESNYKLTLSDFNVQRTSCNPVCGDGTVTPDEECDLGTAKNTGEYGGCNPDCTLAPYCGDDEVQSNEDCDNGANVSTYGAGGDACAPGCVLPPRCGDEIVQGAYETCDQGNDNGRGYGYCGSNCQPGPRCGDGIPQSPQEECDDVRGRVVYNGTSSSACTADCQLKCGNGTVEAGEQCDDGEAENTGGYDRCSANCRLGPRCGDGVRQANEGEECDDGQNDGDYGECAPGCELGPRCGDGVVQSEGGERCDEGDDNVASGYGQGICTTRCLPAPYCGDRAVDVAHGEACDDGVNDGSPGSCEEDCSGWVPLPECGDGNLDAGEQCDEGSDNGRSNSTCDSRCRYRCGNGAVDAGEECDDGVNDGSFGTCTPDCTLAPYCGDGNRDAPFEQCDLGDDNEDDPYGRNLCTTGCERAPFCGDGRIQSEFGEQCDGTSGCNRTTCKYVIPE